VSDEECWRSGAPNAQNLKCVSLVLFPNKLCATPEMIANPLLNKIWDFPPNVAPSVAP